MVSRREERIATGTTGAGLLAGGAVMRHKGTEIAHQIHGGEAPKIGPIKAKGAQILRARGKGTGKARALYAGGAALGLVGAPALGTALTNTGPRLHREPKPTGWHRLFKADSSNSFIGAGIQGTRAAVTSRGQNLREKKPAKAYLAAYGPGAVAGFGANKLAHAAFDVGRKGSRLRHPVSAVAAAAGVAAALPASSKLVGRVSPGYEATATGVRRKKTAPVRPSTKASINEGRANHGGNPHAFRHAIVGKSNPDMADLHVPIVLKPRRKRKISKWHSGEHDDQVKMLRAKQRKAVLDAGSTTAGLAGLTLLAAPKLKRLAPHAAKIERAAFKTGVTGGGIAAVSGIQGARINRRDLKRQAQVLGVAKSQMALERHERNGGQGRVRISTLQNYRRAPGLRFGNTNYTAGLALHMKKAGPTNPVQVHLYKDRPFIDDGAHRLWASQMNGKKTVLVAVQRKEGNSPYARSHAVGRKFDDIRTARFHRELRRTTSLNTSRLQQLARKKPTGFQARFNERAAQRGEKRAQSRQNVVKALWNDEKSRSQHLNATRTPATKYYGAGVGEVVNRISHGRSAAKYVKRDPGSKGLRSDIDHWSGKRGPGMARDGKLGHLDAHLKHAQATTKTLYRGHAGEHVGSKINFTHSSWSTNPKVAERFARHRSKGGPSTIYELAPGAKALHIAPLQRHKGIGMSEYVARGNYTVAGRQGNRVQLVHKALIMKPPIIRPPAPHVPTVRRSYIRTQRSAGGIIRGVRVGMSV